MKEILSSELGGPEPITFGQQSGALDLYDGLKTPYSEDVIILSPNHAAQIEAFVRSAAANYSPEATRVYRGMGIPSLVVRVDCTVDPNGRITPYEMEDSPSGQGITHTIHTASGANGVKQAIQNHYQQTVGDLPVVLVSRERNHGTDDHLIVGAANYVGQSEHIHTPPGTGPVIVKAIPGRTSSREPYMHLQSRLVAPLETEGDKTYAQKLGQLTAIMDPSELLRDDAGELASQVVKARVGSMAMGVSIYLTPTDRKTYGKNGIVSATRLARNVQEYAAQDGALMQPFAAPIQLHNPEGRSNAIMRVFVLVSSGAEGIRAQAIGGCFVARPELMVHGASNAVNGAVLVQ